MTSEPMKGYVAIELFKNAIESIADQMALTVIRTSRSSLVKEDLDFSAALCDAEGRLIAQALCQPRHMCSIPTAIEAVFHRYGDQFARGDVYALNDPYEGGSHLPDIYLLKPIFRKSALLAFACTVAHHTDIGGRVAGGNASDSTEIYQEGLRIPPIKLYDKGKPDEAIFRILEKNVRVPDKVLGDLRAQISACSTGEKEFLRLAERFRPDQLSVYQAQLLSYTEEFTRREIMALPDGDYEFTDHIDDDGIQPEPITIHVKLIKRGDSITVDFTGTSPSTKGAINPTFSYVRSACYACIRSVLSLDIPNNSGFFVPIQFIAPEGSFVNPVLPSPVAARGLAGMRVTETVFGALAQMLPNKVFACGVGLDTGVTIAGYQQDRKPFVFLEFLYVSWGGSPNRDGMDGVTLPHGNYSNAPVEIVEAEQPLMIEQYGFVPDTGGAGKYRGGLAIVRKYRLLSDEGMLQVRSDRRKFLPYGLQGGKPGTPSSNVLNPTRENTTLPSKFLRNIKRDDVFRHQTAGAGGWGNPLERDPQKVLEDVINEKLTRDFAQREYGIILKGDGTSVDLAATRRLRQRMTKNWEENREA